PHHRFQNQPPKHPHQTSLQSTPTKQKRQPAQRPDAVPVEVGNLHRNNPPTNPTRQTTIRTHNTRNSNHRNIPLKTRPPNPKHITRTQNPPHPNNRTRALG